MCFKSGNYNPNVFISTTIGMVFFLVILYCSIVSGHVTDDGKDYRANGFKSQKHLDFNQYMGHWYNVAEPAKFPNEHKQEGLFSTFEDVKTTYMLRDSRKARALTYM